MLVLATPVQAAAPNYIMVSGPGLARPVLLSDWNENHELLLAVVGAPRVKGSLVRRPRLDLALFWAWQGQPRPTRPSQANQHGWFYPADRSRPAVIDVMSDGKRIPRRAPARLLAILARHGVPIRLN
jgi:hypothetical protein